MKLDESAADSFLEVSFRHLRSRPATSWPARAALSNRINGLLKASGSTDPEFPNSDCHLFASASIELWHRAIHSFLVATAMRQTSPIWASVSGYYASHFVMRAVAHALGVFKCYAVAKHVQVIIDNGKLICTSTKASGLSEHEFYWQVVKSHSHFKGLPTFRTNGKKDLKADSSHRVFANYLDHIDAFRTLQEFQIPAIRQAVRRISAFDRHIVTEVNRGSYPDIENVLILAYQRIVEFREFIDARVGSNRFWKVHRDPAWCQQQMVYFLRETQLPEVKEHGGLEELSLT